MKTEKKYIQTIISANNDNSLAIFVGAGISKSSETNSVKLPSWNDLIEDLKAELEIENESDYLKIAQLYYLVFEEFTYYKKLKEYFPEHISPSIIHKLIFDINPHVIITTNWDILLEKTIQENAYIYDVVCSDNDLVKSSLQNKLIKMHGDFKNHNIVFKEDDYLNYNRLFPLIENYVKSILSTHTVIFIGYSYSDFNLKQIVKWIQNYSNVKPPMYLVTDKRSDNEIKYLKNHGITTIVIEKIDDKKFPIKDDLADYSKKMHTFLSRIKTKDELSAVDNPKEAVDFILNQLKPLNELEGILVEQIQNALKWSRLVYSDDSVLEPILSLCHFGTDKRIKEIYKKFKEILNGIDPDKKEISPNVLTIFKILNKAQIKGIKIIVSKDDNDQKYIPFKDYLKDDESSEKNVYFDFDFKNLTTRNPNLNEIFELAFKLYNLDKLEEAFEWIEKAITICIKEKNYTKLFIAIFNRNVLLESLKYTVNYREKNIKNYEDVEKHDLKERYYNLPKDLKIVLEPIYQFLDLSFIYKHKYQVSKDLEKKENSKRTIESGGCVFSSGVNKFPFQQDNLINFVLKNKIMIEDYKEYKSIHKDLVNIALIRQIQKDTHTLTKTELYACIKYIKYDDLDSLLKQYYQKDSPSKGKLELDSNLKDWLINTVLANITKQYLSFTFHFNKFEYYIQNTIFILSLVKHEQKDADRILQKIIEILENGKNTMIIFESINLFMGIQHNLHNLEVEKNLLINMIETIINKLIYKKLMGPEYREIVDNKLPNLYGYAQLGKVVFGNKAMIDKLLAEVETYHISQKIEITQNLILNIYEISNENIKEEIKNFALSIDIKEEKGVYTSIIFEIYLVIFDFKPFSTELKQAIENYLEQHVDGTEFYTGSLYKLDDQIDYLKANKNITGLEAISEKLKITIKQNEELKRFSHF